MLLTILFTINSLLSAPDSNTVKIAGIFKIPNKEMSLLKLEAFQDSILNDAKLSNKESISIKVKDNKSMIYAKMRHARKEHFEVSIQDVKGNEVFHESLDYEPNHHIYKFDVHSMSPGFYIFKIYSDKSMLLRDFHLEKGR